MSNLLNGTGAVPSLDCFCNDNQQKSGSDTKKVGVWLEEPTLIHGQLYVAAPRVADPQHLHFAVDNGVS